MTKRSISVAFQGGGAKIAGLLAAAEAIAGLKDEMEATTISGSSAGAIVALMLASDVKFDEVKKALRKYDDEIRRRFKKRGRRTLMMKGALFSLFGTPVFSQADFNDIISKILNDVGIDPTKKIKEVISKHKKLFIIVSDVVHSRSEIIENDTVRDALRKTCAIPFIFSSFVSADQGQFIDGGVFDNLPIEVLIKEAIADHPIFAIGFEKERLEPSSGALQYILSIASSAINNKMAGAADLIGEDYIHRIKTSLTTLDFDRISSVGIDEEYDNIKNSTESFFKNWLSGGIGTPTSRTGARASLSLRQTEESLISYVESAFGLIPGRHSYVRMRVVANSLYHPHLPDEIIVEQLLEIPPDATIPGTIIPLIDGSGAHRSTACSVALDNKNGKNIDFSQFNIEDEYNKSNGAKFKRSSILILFKDNLSLLTGRKVYVSKREQRFGFMAPLRAGRDHLSITAAYWGADEMSIELLTPPMERKLQCDWSAVGTGANVVEFSSADPDRAGWLAVGAKLNGVPKNGHIKGVFNLQ